MDALRENRSALDARGVDHCAALPVVSLDTLSARAVLRSSRTEAEAATREHSS